MNGRELESGRKPSLGRRLKDWSRVLKRDIMALYFAMKHPRTPLYAKVGAAIVVGYALSPVDLIPDFIPVLGYLDDIILLPLGIALVIRLIPRDVLDECRRYVEENPPPFRPRIWISALVIVTLWLMVAYWAYQALGPDFFRGVETWIEKWLKFTGDIR